MASKGTFYLFYGTFTCIGDNCHHRPCISVLPYHDCHWHNINWPYTVIMFLAIANIPRQFKKGNYRFAFISSAVTIASLLIAVAVEVFPNLLYATNNPANSITIQNAASSAKTMKTLLIIALIGTPLVAVYTTFVFWTFKGKVKLDEMSY